MVNKGGKMNIFYNFNKDSTANTLQFGVVLEGCASTLTQGGGGNYPEGVTNQRWIT